MKIGDKEYTEEEVTQLVEQGSRAQEELKVVKEVTEKYGLDVGEFVQQSQNAFGALVGLQESGVIDQDGNVIRQEPKAATPKASEGNPPSNPDSNPNPGSVPNADDIASIALGKVEGRLGDFQKQIQSIQQSQQRIGKAILNGQMKKAFPNLDDEEIDIIMSQAVTQKKDVWEVAKARAEKLSGVIQSQVDNFAKKNNINMEEINRLNEMKSKEGGIGQALTEGKKVSFKKGDENTVTPREATEQYFKIANQ